jgi:phosphotransferase system HPr-like phosphotransfer protein
VDAKSVLDLMTLVAEPGVELTLEGQGDDAEAAIDQLLRYIEDGFPIVNTKGQKPA